LILIAVAAARIDRDAQTFRRQNISIQFIHSLSISG
jgi:hypothetical protein